MSLFLSANRLASRGIRNNIVSGNNNFSNLRNLVTSNTPLQLSNGAASTVTQIDDNSRSISNNLTTIETPENISVSMGEKFKNWISNTLKYLPKFSFTEAFGQLLAVLENLKAFDWNSTDKEIQELIKQNNLSLYSIWGGVAGKAFGYAIGTAVGYGLSMALPVIGSGLLAKTVAGKVAAEGVEDLIGDLKAAINQTRTVKTTNKVLQSYMNARNFLKSIPKDQLKALFGNKLGEHMKTTWGEPNAPTLTFNTLVDDGVEWIGNVFGQGAGLFAEEFLEEAWDSFVESGFIIAQEWDAAYAQQDVATTIINGPIRNIDIIPDVNAEDEVFTLRGLPESQVIPSTQQFLNNYRLMNNRNVGTIVAGDYQESVAARPMLRKLIIEFSERETPPWVMANNKRPRRSFISIPDIKVGTTWEQIKKAAKHFMWGPFRATVHLTNRRQMVVYGQTKDIAVNKAKELADLSDVEIMRIHCSEEVEVPTKQKKTPVMMYPKAARLMHRKNNLDGNGNIVINNTYFDTEMTEFLLWIDEEPAFMPVIN